MRVFKLVTGTTLFHHLEGLRIQKACELLGSTDAKIGAVARSVGFAGPGYFVNVFRRLVDETPLAYRAKL